MDKKINIEILCDELTRLKTLRSITNHIVDSRYYKKTKIDIKDAKKVISYMMELD